MIFGVLLISAEPSFNELISSEAIRASRTSLSDAIELLKCIDKGKLMIRRCRECIEELLEIYDLSAAATTNEHLSTQANRLDSVRLTPLSSQRGADVDLNGLQQVPGIDKGAVSSTEGFESAFFDTDLDFDPFGGLLIGSDFDLLNGL